MATIAPIAAAPPFGWVGSAAGGIGTTCAALALPLAWMPVFTVKQAFENPFLKEIDMVSAVPHPRDPDMKLLSNPLKFDGARLAQRPCRPLEETVEA